MVIVVVETEKVVNGRLIETFLNHHASMCHAILPNIAFPRVDHFHLIFTIWI